MSASAGGAGCSARSSAARLAMAADLSAEAMLREY